MYPLCAKTKASPPELVFAVSSRGSGPVFLFLNTFYRIAMPEDYYGKNSASEFYFTPPSATLHDGSSVWSV
jgi:hypothetical protein